jgi:endonuclease YncB( thermonuclease family)
MGESDNDNANLWRLFTTYQRMPPRARDKAEVLALALALTLTLPVAVDGDTIRSGESFVRLVQINTPERRECGYKEATTYTAKFLKLNGKLVLTTDKNLDSFDEYGRALGYLTNGNRNLNLELVKYGYAKPYFYKGMRGKYANLIERYARQAKANRLGLWKCNDRSAQWNKKSS